MSNTYPPYVPSSTDQDILPVVDENDTVIGSAPRREVHARALRHRAVHAVVVNKAGQVLLQKRSSRKDSHPGWWDISMGGHVDAGEEYDAAARREMREELGIHSAVLEHIATRIAAPESGWEFVRLYECRSEGPFAPAPSEIDEVRWVPVHELFPPDGSPSSWRVTGSGLISIRLWARHRGVVA